MRREQVEGLALAVIGYAYSGEGLQLLHSVIADGLGIDLDRTMQERVFDRFGLTRTG